jgi:hypothetical protein
MGNYITPEKINIEDAAANERLQITKPKLKKEVVE